MKCLKISHTQLSSIAHTYNAIIELDKKAKIKHQHQLKAITLEQKKKMAFAKKLYQESQPIKGTLAEKYLKEHRSVAMEKYPEDIRFHPGIYSKLNGKTLPAMLVIARGKEGKIQAVQATYLDVKTAHKVDKGLAAVQKQTFGVLKGAAVTIQGKHNAPTLLAEGIETGLSLAKALPNTSIKVTLSQSNFMNVNSQMLNKRVIFCLDNDGKNLKENKLIIEASQRLLSQGKEVNFMVPTSLGNTKQDYNDIIKNLGVASIQKDYNTAISYQEFYNIPLEKNHKFLLKSKEITKQNE